MRTPAPPPPKPPRGRLARLRAWAQRLKRDVLAVYCAARDPRTPWALRLLAFAVAAYALSPIDLIPDFIPVIGLLDDLLIVPLGLALVIRLLPPPVLAAARERAGALLERPRSALAAAAIVALWIAVAAAGVAWWLRR
ncbi:MAG TPA: YkvA family protein [Burkholderiaceae bacterium]|nr:YkvA family protein [Burkholderiaceae bacterium]